MPLFIYYSPRVSSEMVLFIDSGHYGNSAQAAPVKSGVIREKLHMCPNNPDFETPSQIIGQGSCAQFWLTPV